ncbi:MAG: winged helix-turn-helix domain-containing protein, partial [Gallionellaceae bacterium]|nr:winged helix-turn-helix domain-containing protein [Gallionellaceae bacterium]
MRRCRRTSQRARIRLAPGALLRPGTILTRDELEERIYGWNEEVESNAVDFLIHGVRRKLGA